MLLLLALLFQLFGELRELALAAKIQPAQLEIGDDVVDPRRVQQEVLEVVELLLQPGGRTFVLLDAVLELELLIAHPREFFL